MNYRCVTANLVVCATAAAIMPIGCGGAQEKPHHMRHESASHTIREPPPSVEVPEATAREMKTCVETAGYRWTEPSYAFVYDLETSQQGNVLKVKLRESTLRDASLEACFERALAAMDVPQDALRKRSSKPISGGESMVSSRANVSIVQAAAAPIALAPIVIPALGVTMIVAISLDIVRKATSEPDCKAVKEDCIIACNGKLPSGDFGFRFWNCVNQCMRTAGC